LTAAHLGTHAKCALYKMYSSEHWPSQRGKIKKNIHQTTERRILRKIYGPIKEKFFV